MIDDRLESLFAVSRQNLSSPEIDLFGKILGAEGCKPQVPTFLPIDSSQGQVKGSGIRKKLTMGRRPLAS